MIQKPKGTLDILPEETVLWHFAENIMREKARLFGFEEIRFPTVTTPNTVFVPRARRALREA